MATLGAVTYAANHHAAERVQTAGMTVKRIVYAGVGKYWIGTGYEGPCTEGQQTVSCAPFALPDELGSHVKGCVAELADELHRGLADYSARMGYVERGWLTISPMKKVLDRWHPKLGMIGTMACSIFQTVTIGHVPADSW